jgi:hypothetical protein
MNIQNKIKLGDIRYWNKSNLKPKWSYKDLPQPPPYPNFPIPLLRSPDPSSYMTTKGL